MPTLADGLRSNAFGLLRLLLALVVIVSHTWPLGGFGVEPMIDWSGGQINIGQLGLIGFFAISGLLITTSADRLSGSAFLWRRALRLLPGFWGVLLFGAVVIGPAGYAVDHGGLAGYWTAGPQGPLSYLWRNAALYIGQFGLHDVFATTPWGVTSGGSVINGSVWSLYYEARCYLLVWLLMITGVLRRARWSVLAGAGVAIALGALAPHWGAARPLSSLLFGPGEGAMIAGAFLLGSSVAVLAERIRPGAALLLGCAAVTVATLVLGGFVEGGYLAWSLLLIIGAVRAPRRLHGFGRRHDLSYGTYLYAFPVQQLLIAVGVARWGPVAYLLLTLATVLPLAAASWWLIERRALAWKDRRPGRRSAVRAISGAATALGVRRSPSSGGGPARPAPSRR